MRQIEKGVINNVKIFIEEKMNNSFVETEYISIDYIKLKFFKSAKINKKVKTFTVDKKFAYMYNLTIEVFDYGKCN